MGVPHSYTCNGLNNGGELRFRELPLGRSLQNFCIPTSLREFWRLAPPGAAPVLSEAQLLIGQEPGRVHPEVYRWDSDPWEWEAWES
jgi:hypothetical protein